MRHKTYIFLLSLIFTGGLTGLKAVEVISERIIFLNEDGKTFLSYSTNRTDYTSYNLWFDKKTYPNTEDAFNSYLYFYPNTYSWQSESATNHLLHINQGDYAQLQEQRFGNDLKEDSSGLFTYCNWNGTTKTSEGHYGSWNTPDNFTQYMYVWVVPGKFEIVDYACNRKGEWVKRKNTIAFYGENLNDVVFTIQFKRKSQEVFDIMSKAIAGNDLIQIKQDQEGTIITLDEGILFPSGRAELNNEGSLILTRIAKALKEETNTTIIISGHTDNQAIRGDLAKRYPSNWELSAMRALSVLHFISSQGIDESRLEIRACGSTKPVASNSTVGGRAKNRRIELSINN